MLASLPGIACECLNSNKNDMYHIIFRDVVTWSYPFVVKDRMLHSFVLRKLETFEPLGSKERVKLLDGFYDECSKYTL